MAAGDNLQSKQFYHGSDHEFQPGEKVLSVNDLTEQGLRKNGVDRFRSADPGSVFMAGTRAGAQGWGKHIYQVQPDSDVESHKWGYDTHTTSSATVVKKISDKRLGPRGYAPRYT